ncbi:MAG TPA: DUF2809 domain-containing protein [Gemmatimonadales bacterium]|nr:DUF2809 domain-containing protein [Gemmatimonadales bacterium]
MSRSRALYFGLTLLVVALGLASRRYRAGLPAFIGAYAGDALWAAMVFLLAATVWAHAQPRVLAVGALAFSFGVELSQLHRAPWLDALRATRAGALVLGQGFLWSDLLCYTAGVGIAAGADLLLRSRAPTPARAHPA